jgi:asparagine synthase (glutamine-hydrolysing)
MEEVFVKDSRLISQKEWQKYIEDIKTEIEEEKEKKTEDELKEQLKKDIISAVEKRTKNKEKFAVLFSGGVDSTLIALICKQLKKDFSSYCIGFRTGCMEEAKDLIVARQIAKELNLHFFEKEINLEDAEKLIIKVIKILPKPTIVDIQYVVNVGVAAVVLSSIELAKKHGKESVFFSGLGSEEIFAGYLRHEEAKDVHEECWKGLKMMQGRDLVRDFAVANDRKISIMTPFLDRDVIKTAMKIHVSRKINKLHKKIILREIAEELGLEHEFAWRKKLGAQYGSKSIKIIEQLARDNGFKLKKEYLANLLQKAI